MTYADEAHHVPADTYQKVMNHFTPKLWLGMTATPDKRDDNMEGRNVYELFNYQIAYEIRLQQAMEEKLLCPFHYFGITDLAIIGDNGDTSRDFSMLTSEERVKHIINQADYYGYSGDKVKGLIFCSNIKETEELSAKFNEMINPSTGKKFRTIALNGSASEQERQNVFERLAMNEEDATIENQPLDYIFSVEILNEGVDIVEVNQVIMLRPTQSPVVFIQQLGRGLRKANGKEYVVILDFIGNYNNNFMIPIALSGDRTYNKDNIRRYIMEGGRVIPGASTVHFDEISRKRIFASVDNANFSDIKLIKENYTNLKNKLGRIPRLHDFDDYGEMDVMRIFDNNSLGSYYKFLVKYEKEYKIRLSEDEEKVIEFVSKKLANGKRIQELQILKRILTYAHGLSKIGLFAGLSEDMREYGKNISQDQKENIVNVMTNKFPAGASKKTYSQCVFMEQEGNDYKPTKLFMQMLANDEFYGVLQELVDFGISRYERDYKNTYDQTDLVLYQKYTYEDVCRLLNWEQNEVPLNIGGYKFDKKTKTFPVFINYDKAEDISDTTKYEDHFIPGFRDRLIAISKSGRNLQSEDVQNFLKAKERGIQVELFLRKNKDDNEPWYRLILLEAMLFEPYYPLGTEKDKKGNDVPCKKYKYLNNPINGFKKNEGDRFLNAQFTGKYCEQEYVKRLRKSYNNRMNELNEVLKTVITSLSITAVIAIVTVATAGAFAGSIAVILVGSNFAGLSGAALTSACLAYLGGGAIAAGGAGMLGGTIAIVGGGAALGIGVGAGVGGAVGSAGLLGKKNTIMQSAKLLTSVREIFLNDEHDVEFSNSVYEQYLQNITEIEKGLVELRLKKDVAKGKEKKAIAESIKKAEESVEAMKVARKNMLKYNSSFAEGLQIQ